MHNASPFYTFTDRHFYVFQDLQKVVTQLSHQYSFTSPASLHSSPPSISYHPSFPINTPPPTPHLNAPNFLLPHQFSIASISPSKSTHHSRSYSYTTFTEAHFYVFHDLQKAVNMCKCAIQYCFKQLF